MNPGPLDTRQLLDRTIIRIRRELATAAHLAEIVGVNEPTPQRVTRALDTLDAWTRRLLATALKDGALGRQASVDGLVSEFHMMLNLRVEPADEVGERSGQLAGTKGESREQAGAAFGTSGRSASCWPMSLNLAAARKLSS